VEINLMNKRTIVFGAAAAVLTSVLVFAGSLSAQPSGMDGDGYDHHHRDDYRATGFGMRGQSDMMRAVRKLDLNEEQQAQLRGLMESRREVFRDQMRTLQETRKAMQDAMNAEPYDAARVQQLAEAQGAAVTGMILKRAQTWQEIRSVLTPGQRAELNSLRSGSPCRNSRLWIN
jgi:Spy/CpxP family protein refolding chaperone